MLTVVLSQHASSVVVNFGPIFCLTCPQSCYGEAGRRGWWGGYSCYRTTEHALITRGCGSGNSMCWTNYGLVIPGSEYVCNTGQCTYVGVSSGEFSAERGRRETGWLRTGLFTSLWLALKLPALPK